MADLLQALEAECGAVTVSDWHGYTRYDFSHDGRRCVIVAPALDAASSGVSLRCLWRARFFGAFPYVDLAMLARGWYIIYMDIADLYGCPQAVAHWNAFYVLVRKLGFPAKLPLMGMSRGGLIMYHWAAENPEKVACMYADAPVCDIRSWPAGWGDGEGSAEDWERCKMVYGLTDDTAKTFSGNPIDRLEPLARAGVPILHVCGDVDTAVPYTENTQVLVARYRALGGVAEEIVKPGVGHHPHSLEDPTPIVQFIERHTR